MATSHLEEILRQATEQTFEALAFLLPEEPDGPANTEAHEALVQASVGFTGPQQGQVRLLVPARLMSPLATNMMGLEASEATADQQRDALGEVLNVICGNLLPAMAGSEAVFKVLAPQVPALPLGKRDRLAARIQLAFDEGWADAALFLTEEAA